MFDASWILQRILCNRFNEENITIEAYITRTIFWPVLIPCDWKKIRGAPKVKIHKNKIREWIEATERFYKMQKELSQMSGIPLQKDLENMLEDLKVLGVHL